MATTTTTPCPSCPLYRQAIAELGQTAMAVTVELEERKRLERDQDKLRTQLELVEVAQPSTHRARGGADSSDDDIQILPSQPAIPAAAGAAGRPGADRLSIGRETSPNREMEVENANLKQEREQLKTSLDQAIKENAALTKKNEELNDEIRRLKLQMDEGLQQKCLEMVMKNKHPDNSPLTSTPTSTRQRQLSGQKRRSESRGSSIDRSVRSHSPTQWKPIDTDDTADPIDPQNASGSFYPKTPKDDGEPLEATVKRLRTARDDLYRKNVKYKENEKKFAANEKKYQDQVRQLHQQLKHTVGKQKEAVERAAVIPSLEEKMKKLENDIETLTKEIAGEKEKLSSAQNELNAAQASNKKLTSELDKSKGNTKAYRSEVKKLTRALDPSLSNEKRTTSDMFEWCHPKIEELKQAARANESIKSAATQLTQFETVNEQLAVYARKLIDTKAELCRKELQLNQEREAHRVQSFAEWAKRIKREPK